MTILSLFAALFAAALLSSAITCMALWWYYRKVVGPALDRRVEQALKQLAAEVGREVRSGVVEGVTDLAHSDTLRRTTEKVASSGAALVDEGLNVLLGRPRRKP